MSPPTSIFFTQLGIGTAPAVGNLRADPVSRVRGRGEGRRPGSGSVLPHSRRTGQLRWIRSRAPSGQRTGATDQPERSAEIAPV